MSNYGFIKCVLLFRMAATKVIIDTDPGTDDALAIFMALEAHRRGCLEVLAITTVHGNSSLHNINNNIFRILRLANMLEVLMLLLLSVFFGGDQLFLDCFSLTLLSKICIHSKLLTGNDSMTLYCISTTLCGQIPLLGRQ